MKIGLLDVDGFGYPNLALMKISAWHKSRGDTVEKWMAIDKYDSVYKSKVFSFTDDTDVINADAVIQGGTGYDLTNELPKEIEHIMPDYSLYGIKDTAYGFLTRGCPRSCPFCIVAGKEGRKSYKVADISEWWNGQKHIQLMDPNLLASKDHPDLLRQLSETRAKVDVNQGADCRLLNDESINALNKVNIEMIHFAWDLMKYSDEVLRGLKLYTQKGAVTNIRKRSVYVLTNYNTSAEEDLYRVYKLMEIGFDPYIMIYDKSGFAKESGHMKPFTELIKKYTVEQIEHYEVVHKIGRWVNNKIVFRSCARFEDYDSNIKSAPASEWS